MTACLTISANPHNRSRIERVLQQIHIADHELRLAEDAHHVLEAAEIDAVFSAHAGVDLGQQGGGDKPEAHPAHIGGGNKSRDVADDSAADSHNDRGAVRFQIHELPVDVGYRIQGLDRFSAADGDDRIAGKIFSRKVPACGDP